MISAYGGIRWGTGMSRAFQYEKTQSRIGLPPWDAPLQFIENSPIFWVEKVHTPYLSIHNDEDDAVPWYQGIEFFSAMRRLGKEAYMFVYNGEPHGLRQRDNMKHWTVHQDSSSTTSCSASLAGVDGEGARSSRRQRDDRHVR
jgi:dipeptidyl aminopeptidase/acylaminoacyl peptidase